MLHCLHFFSPCALALLILLVSILFSLGCLRFVQRFFPGCTFEDCMDLGEIISDAIGGLFALLFALVVVAAWQNHDRLDTVVTSEADTLNSIYRNIESYPPELSRPGAAMLRKYVHRVVEVEWKLQEQGQQDPAAQALYLSFNRMLCAYQPSPAEAPRHSQTLKLIDSYRSLRHDRLRGGGGFLDSGMWLALFLAAGIVILYSCFFVRRNKKAYDVMITALGAAVGLIFYLLLLNNYAFGGPGGIGSEAFQDLIGKYWLID